MALGQKLVMSALVPGFNDLFNSLCQSPAGQTGGDQARSCFSCHVCTLERWLMSSSSEARTQPVGFCFPLALMTLQREFYFHHMLSCRVMACAPPRGVKGLPAALLYQSLGLWTLSCSVMHFFLRAGFFHKISRKKRGRNR